MGPSTRALGIPVLVLLGNMSYAIYLLHWPVFVAISPFTVRWPFWLYEIVRLVVIFWLALASWYLVERPLMLWRRKALEPTSAGGGAASSRLRSGTMWIRHVRPPGEADPPIGRRVQPTRMPRYERFKSPPVDTSAPVGQVRPGTELTDPIDHCVGCIWSTGIPDPTDSVRRRDRRCFVTPDLWPRTVPGAMVVIVGTGVIILALTGLTVQAFRGNRTVSVQRDAHTIHDARTRQCLLQLHRRASPQSGEDRRTGFAHRSSRPLSGLGDVVTLLKGVGSWVTFADPPSTAAVRLSLRNNVTGAGACLGTEVIGTYPKPHHRITVRIGSGASVAGMGPPPAPPPTSSRR